MTPSTAEAPSYVLGIDIGTASTKAVLCTPDGGIVRQARREHPTSLPRPGWAEHDADGVWWADVHALIRELLPSRPELIRAVCVSGLGPCVLPADAEGRPLRPALLYGVDTRAVPIAERIERELGGRDAVLARCGSRLSSQSAGPKLAWLRHHEPRVWAATAKVFTAHSYLTHRLTGAYVIDHHTASQYAPLYDLAARAWYEPWAQAVAPGLALPELAWPADIAGRVTAGAAAETGLAAGTPVAVGTIDAWAEAESVDVREPGDLMLMYGSTMFFVGVTPTPVRSPALWSTAGNHPGQHTLAAGMASSGSITQWFSDLTGGTAFPQLTTEAAASPPGADGLLALPYFAGERTPVADPQARGIIAGLTLRHTRGDVYRALLESTALAVRHHFDAFADAGFTPGRVVAVGGGTTDPLWPQIVSDVTGVAQEYPHERCGASYGDAKFAALAIGAVPPGARWNRPAQVLTPSDATRELFDDRYAAYQELRTATGPLQHRLAAAQDRHDTP
ncbi:FGGY-family carbohydrate kinase [Streptomyces sp. NPDC050161]|uniref:FGGY-family carbohydrate kinase n=1 Tax=Streptomyces sp. NPDC050161 TaxID=3365604 RepID=UPI0037A178B0